MKTPEDLEQNLLDSIQFTLGQFPHKPPRTRDTGVTDAYRGCHRCPDQALRLAPGHASDPAEAAAEEAALDQAVHVQGRLSS
jgi:hypothetical protein